MKTSLPLSKINYFIIAVLLLSSFTLYAQPKREFRSTWFQTVWNGDWPKTKGTTSGNLTTQKSELTTWFDNLKNANINAVSFQIRSMCDAMYPSDYAPWSEFLSGTRGTAPYGSFDFLDYAIEEAHSRGMELHVWLNPYRIGSRSN
ncbi:MAG TPA: family 10 glycosylhydrolase, partial [Paludibacteraceae bacterium]|nr:family 10 glycosylhydrolase [Paludibacteraceae bacterium]